MIVTMTSDFWESVINDDQVNSLPTWANVERALARLDGKGRTLVTLEDNNGSTLYVGGSTKGAWLPGAREIST